VSLVSLSMTDRLLRFPIDKARTIHTKLFPAGSKTGIKKTLKLKKKADFNLDFSYIQKPDQDLFVISTFSCLLPCLAETHSIPLSSFFPSQSLPPNSPPSLHLRPHRCSRQPD
jgi:hypothetical protein